METQSELVCRICARIFSSVSTKNRHLKTIHNEEIEEKISQHVKCPICPEDRKTPLANHDKLLNHLTEIHNVSIKITNLNFRSRVEFEFWRSNESREVDYTYSRSVKRPNGEEDLYFNCNRSNFRGYESNYKKRAAKAGGSIRISGICPSRICAKILQTGMMNVKFIETHVGHEDELRTKRLLKKEEEVIVKQLNAGVSNERILQDARRIENNKLQRINLITRVDLRYLTRKFNIDRKRDADDMIATTLKVDEWNKDGKNQAFLFKKIGDNHPILKNEDFALGFMNGIMEKKLKDFKNIICIDGTHGTNRLNFDLTTVLVKDDKNMGFPVAFLISNRLDQLIQEVFFRALKEKLSENIEVEYIMTDDDPKYYNAWTKVMETTRKPRRLLCTWHVVKNWNIQGRSKIRSQEIKSGMKKEMKKILRETDVMNFMELKEKYLNYLKEMKETDFLNYLEKYYFQSNERIMMWAHCFRIGAGINTNMAIESLNKVLKYNKMKGNRNLRIEKLLDLLEDLVNEMWKRIINEERPHANNYQHKTTIGAHKKGEEMINMVRSEQFGKFVVKSSTSEKLYNVCYGELCDEDCRNTYCSECRVCIHKYICECPEYVIKTALCKHIHSVVLYEKRSESVLGVSNIQDQQNVFVNEPSTSKLRYQEELSHYLQDAAGNQNEENFISLERTKEILKEDFNNWVNEMDKEEIEKCMKMYNTFKNSVSTEKKRICKKRKMEKQTYYPIGK